MALKQRITDDLKTALLGGDRFVVDTLRGLKAAILNEEVAQSKRDEGLSDVEVEQIVAKEIKKRNESAVLYENAKRTELAENERKEAAVLSAYLPQQLSEDEVKRVVERVVDELGGVSGAAAIGQVIGAVKKRVGNTSDGATIAKIVKLILN